MICEAANFACEMYGFPKVANRSEARHVHFKTKYKPKVGAGPLDSIKSITTNTFPPCRSVLIEQVKRAWFISHIYKNASYADPNGGLDVCDYGRQIVDGRWCEMWFEMWFEGNHVPKELEKLRDEG